MGEKKQTTTKPTDKQQQNPNQPNLTTVQINTCWKHTRAKTRSPHPWRTHWITLMPEKPATKKSLEKKKMVFNLLQERQQIALNIKHQAVQTHQCCRCSAYNDWAGGRGTQPSLCSSSPAVFVQFWQPCSNIRTTSSAVFKHVSNAALSKKDGQCCSRTTPNKHDVIFDLGT